MANYHLNKTMLADILKNSDVVDKSINKPILTCFNKQQCHCQHSINDTSENMFLNSSSIIHQHASASGTSEVQLVNSPTRSPPVQNKLVKSIECDNVKLFTF
ncbi:unnamed protein product [Adineta steineri]|uniref:Uncharacterized protein n=1 Tax=Adineta steineri TaxID=433720 RepID=A0A815I365_9BILA|nr:unnamed protein product [Adineta steineri]CAF3598601.1 unnamed protein product [Adineta steineri]